MYGLVDRNGLQLLFTLFMHIMPRRVGEQAELSDFLTGVEVRDRITGETHSLNALARRRQLLAQVVCADRP